jgi:heme-degrading monooxygenase HmoA
MDPPAMSHGTGRMRQRPTEAMLAPDDHPQCDHRPVIASTPEPPYTAVIFTSLRTEGDNGYAVMSRRMLELAAQQPGFLGVESAREDVGITVSYWVDEPAARAWKQVAEHLVAQERGRSAWYSDYQVRVATVTRSYGPQGPR